MPPPDPSSTAADVLRANLRRLQLLAAAGDILASSLDYAVTLQRVAQLAVPECGIGVVVDDQHAAAAGVVRCCRGGRRCHRRRIAG